MDNSIKVYDVFVIARDGMGTWVWMVYQGKNVITVEYTRGRSGLTARFDLTEMREVA